MKITLVIGDARHNAELPYDGATHVTCNADCPHGCIRPSELGLKLRMKVRGNGIQRRTHDTYFARAVALCCDKEIGTLETRVDTIFGIEEDERVTSGPWRVY